ncbi:hypothetical protein HIM_10772 [Hirsutella minnesotensis 3608]|uniref:Reverse transcriptase domain-containing protein n=1 Tax=Hirsutella minnesotensis 3608 TaxID=1043627 RepID=A0A0F8A1Y3_9HYPO|nr:hypothetical protein HIM_10772 [Hirsutella minnesotensis 3608]
MNGRPLNVQEHCQRGWFRRTRGWVASSSGSATPGQCRYLAKRRPSCSALSFKLRRCRDWKIQELEQDQARAQRRAGQPQQDLEQRAKDAAKGYHDNVRKQKKSHWDDFVTDENNIWKVVKYLKPGGDMFDDKVPPLRRDDGSITKGKGEQGEELLSTFFPPLPTNIEPEGERPQREEIAMPDLTLQEIEEKVMAAKPWKAPGEDGLPAIVWKKLWHVVKHRVWTLFDSSLREGAVPHQWRTAKIIPLKKPGKDDYTLAKAWRPISLLSTLGKILEAVVAERISYAVEAHGLLPANHFGARKRRSADQALVLPHLQGLENGQSFESRQLRRQRGVQWSLQRADACKDESSRHPESPGQMGRRILLGTDRIGGCQRAHIRAASPGAGRPTPRISTITGGIPVLQCGPGAEANQ